MKLIISQYLRTLKERDEFDRLLPDLLLEMGYVAISKPQTGVRQYGVDLAVVGVNPEDGIKELLLIVIKQGDVGRSDWDSGPQSVRASLTEVWEVYFKTHIDPSHENLRKRIVFATTGDLKQDTQISWDSYVKDNSLKANFDFWSGDKVASLITEYMLNENVFDAEDRRHLRRALALAGTVDYDQKDLYRLFLKQLGLNEKGELVKTITKSHKLIKALRIVNLATQIFAKWAEEEGNLKQSLIATERAILWSWHRIQLEPTESHSQYYSELNEFWRAYNSVAREYYEKLLNHFNVQDGLSGYTRESAEFSLIVFEQIGLLATIGLSQILVVTSNQEENEANYENAKTIASALCALIKNNPVSGSPALDSNVIDIVLALTLQVLTGNVLQAQEWLVELVKRLDYTLKCGRNFPIATDSLDDLVDFIVYSDEELTKKMMKMSWLLPTLAGWALLLEKVDLYAVLVRGTKNDYPEVCMQFWHPTDNLSKFIYFSQAQFRCGEAEAPIHLPDNQEEFREKAMALLSSSRHNIIDASSAGMAGLLALDLIACRHFRTPVAPYYWYRLFSVSKSDNVAQQVSV